MTRVCTCLGSCRGPANLGHGWACALELPASPEATAAEPSAIAAARSALEDELEYRSPKGTMTSWDDRRVGRMLAREPVLAREVLRLAELVGPAEVAAPVDLGTRRSSPPTEAEVTAWVRTLCRRAGLHVHLWPDGSSGLVNVPAKYVAVMDAMHVAMLSLVRGEGLPEFAAPSVARAPKKARRR